MILVNSSSYVTPELQAEVGPIPSCMLPVGNRKLLEHQYEALREAFPDEAIYVSLPESYLLTLDERNLIKSLGIKTIFAPEHLSFGESLHYALDTIVTEDQLVRLLYGDVLLHQLPGPDQENVIGVFRPSGQLAPVRSSGPAEKWCGFFVFSEKAFLVRALAITQGNFIQSVELYQEHRRLRPYPLAYWYDFGHVNTYFKSRAQITTQRAFNDIAVQKGILTKTGSPPRKIAAEANWYHEMPGMLKKYIPQLINRSQQDDQYFYSLEYLPYLPLNELFVHGRHLPDFWQELFGLLFNFLEDCKGFNLDYEQRQKVKESATLLVEDKTRRRLEEFAAQRRLNLRLPMKYRTSVLPSLHDIAEECIERTLAQPIHYAVMHGDLCLSNILYDSRLNRIKVIDPRGLNETGEMTIYGDQKYDMAKLCHSFIGLYDFIIAGRYRLMSWNQDQPEINFDLDDRSYQIQDAFKHFRFGSLPTVRDVMPLTVLLFLSMLPLHADRPDRQDAMLVNALRLYKDYVQERVPA